MSALAGRYRDAYLVAKVTVGLGSTIKIVGIVLGGVIFLGGLLFAFLAAAQGGGTDISGVVFIVAIVVGSFYGFIVGFADFGKIRDNQSKFEAEQYLRQIRRKK